ncbi:nitroreductase [Brevibacillus sp. B_LB10_24]|uniref:nitroreductase family protein n=1 Tax=Brevibacillus sp. B_LB10_24 TaxID=3380645 RepID=UPI0038BB5527
MSILQILKERRAVRNYEQREVEEEKIRLLLEAATLAPNDRLREPWHFYVIRGESKERYRQIAVDYLHERFPTKPHLVQSSVEVIDHTPLIIVVTSDIIPDDEDSSEDNEFAVCCAIHSMWLMAKELGLGLVWRTRGVGLVRDKRLYEFIGSPESAKVIGTVFIGYPADEVPATTRTPYAEKTTWM